MATTKRPGRIERPDCRGEGRVGEGDRDEGDTGPPLCGRCDGLGDVEQADPSAVRP